MEVTINYNGQAVAVEVTLPVSCALPGAVAYFVRDGALHSPNPLCAPRSQTPALRLSGSTEPVIPH